MPDDSTAPTEHRFLDETGDSTFYGKGRKLIVGENGISLSFGMGIVRIDRPLAEVRKEIKALQQQVEQDELLNPLPSVLKRMAKGGFFFHACKDTPDVRSVFLRYLRELPCEAEVVIARKIPALFDKHHCGREDEFYADLLSHLIKRRVKRSGTLVLMLRSGDQALERKCLRRLWSWRLNGRKKGGALNVRDGVSSLMCKPH